MIDREHLLASVVTFGTIFLVVMIHYEAFVLLSRLMARGAHTHRRRILVLIFGLLIVHVGAIWIFGISAWWLVEHERVGALAGYESIEFLDYIFMSAVTYTTLGYGDMVPIGPIRFLYGSQALTGFVLITWSATFTFLEMQLHWKEPDSR